MDPTLGTRKFRSPGSRFCLLMVSAASLLAQGCITDRWFKPDHGIQPIEPHISHKALIEHLNQNIRSLHSWSCTDATIVTKPSKLLPIALTLDAVITVERDKNFRLRARSLLGEEADFGSNAERFWFWMRRNKPPWVFTATHAQLGAVGRRLQIPFHPTWIMEALGVMPLDPNTVSVRQPGLDNNTLLFVSEEISPSGEVVRREIEVDTHLGVILAHRLFDATGQRLAEARLSQHRREPSGVVMPHRIELDWPQHDSSMTVHLGTIEINPSDLSAQTFQLPEDSGYKIFHMMRRLDHVETPAPYVPAGERTTDSQTYLEAPPFAQSVPSSGWQPTGHPAPARTAVHSDPEPPPFY